MRKLKKLTKSNYIVNKRKGGAEMHPCNGGEITVILINMHGSTDSNKIDQGLLNHVLPNIPGIHGHMGLYSSAPGTVGSTAMWDEIFRCFFEANPDYYCKIKQILNNIQFIYCSTF